MATDIVEVEGPDGNIYEFPAGTSQEQAVAYFKKSAPKPVTPMESFGRGIVDPINAGAQMLEKILPKSVVDYGNKLNNQLAEYGLVAPVSEKGVAEDIAAQERAFQERRKAAGQEGIDWGRIVGNVASPVNVALGSIAAPMKLAGRMGVGMAGGALSGPTESTEDFAQQKALQAGIGGLGSLGGELLSRGAARVVSPAASRDAGIQQLMEEGITPTIGHLAGPRATAVERALHITPLLGTAISKAEDRTYNDFNRAVANRVLRNVGEKLPGDVPVGTELFAKVDDMLQNKYQEILPKLKGAIDPEFASDISTVKTMAQAMPAEKASTLERILNDKLESRFTSSGLASGESLKMMESELGREARGYLRSPDYDNRKIGEALLEAQASLRNMLVRQNPAEAADLANLNKAWAAATRMEAATAKAAKRGGVFTPDDYLMAVKSSDKSLRGRNVAKGTALDQDFAKTAQRVLGQESKGIGSAYRTAAALGFGGAYMQNPAVLLGELAASTPYSPVGQKLGALAMAARPKGAETVAETIRRATPYTYSVPTGALEAYREKAK